MRIRRLDLLAFGPFTDVTLSLDGDPTGLHTGHIICGPNEAGKSSSLRALRQLLFGIPHTSSDNFLHSNQNLRIGACLENTAGELFECIRRKGRVNTLRGPDDVELVDPAILADMLGGVDEATFSQRFGIDYAELRQGGQAVVEGGGDLGEMLFAAGSGVADLGAVQRQLAKEAEQLFLPKGSKPLINHALAELKESKRQIKDSQLLTSEWVKHDKALREAAGRVEAIDKQLLEQKSEKSRLERLHRAQPLIAGRQRLLEELAEVAHATLLSDDFSGSRRESMAQLKTAEKMLIDTKQTMAKLAQLIDDSQVPQAMLEHRTAITRLFKELGSYQKAAKDRPRLVARLEEIEQQAKTILRELGREPKLEQAEQLRIRRTQRQRIQSLANEFKALQIKEEAAQRSLRELRQELEQVEQQLGRLPVIGDPGELSRAIQLVQKHGDLDQRRAQEVHLLGQLVSQTDVDLQKLRLWQGTLEELERLPVPGTTTVERFEHELADSAAALEVIRVRIQEATEGLLRLDQKLESLRLEHDVPDEDDLLSARKQRDTGWQLVLKSWRTAGSSQDTGADEFIQQVAPGSDLAQAFQTSIDVSDQIADRLRREADRVAEKAKLTADRQDLDRRLDGLRMEQTSSLLEFNRLRADWREAWTSTNIEPLSPREMRSWIVQHAELAEAAASLRKQRTAVASLDHLIEAQRSMLEQRLAEFKLSPALRDSESLAAVLERGEAVVAEMETTLRTRAELEKHLQKLRGREQPCEQEAERASLALQQWRSDWTAVVGQLGLDQAADPLEANSVIESVDELFGHIRDTEETRRRIQGIDRDAAEFTQSVELLLSKLAQDLQDMPVDQAVANLYDRLEAASTAQTKLDGWREQLLLEEAKCKQAELQVLHWRTNLETLCREAGCQTADELPEAEANSAKRKERQERLRSLDEQLLALASGTPLEQFCTEATQQDADQLRATIDRTTEEIDALERGKSEEHKTIGAERTELRRMDGSSAAAEAQEKVEHLLARIRGDAEQYVRLRLAACVLRRSIDRFREASQGPVLERASKLFQELTLGSFDGLRADYDDVGSAVLVGVRPGGQPMVRVEGMSDGTCDQLYLALRLALLDSFLAERGPLPFIVDDILIMFDDARTVAALKALVRLSERTQVIYFTHHDHIVSLAREHLPDRLFIHTLDHRAMAL